MKRRREIEIARLTLPVPVRVAAAVFGGAGEALDQIGYVGVLDGTRLLAVPDTWWDEWIWQRPETD